MKRLLLRLVLPSRKAIDRWEQTRRGGVIRFVVGIGFAWLALGTLFLLAIEMVRPSGLFVGLEAAFHRAPVRTVCALISLGLLFGLYLYLFNEVAYRIARARKEP